MSDLGTETKNTLLSQILAGAYLALFTSDPTDGDTGTEVSGYGYTRQALIMTAPEEGLSASEGDVEFTAAGGDFGIVSHAAIMSANSGGTLLFHKALSPGPANISDGKSLKFLAGEIVASLQ